MAAVLNITLKGNNDEIVFRGDGQGNYHLMAGIKGLGLPNLKTSLFELQGRDGVEITQQYFRSRTIAFVGRVKGITQGDLDTNISDVYAKCVVRDGKTVTTTAIIEMRNGNIYEVLCHYKSLEPIIDRRKNRRLMPFILVGTDPNLYQGTTDEILRVHKEAGTPGYTMPYTLPTDWGTGASSSQVVTIQGEGIIYPVIEIVGTGSNPVITNNRNNQSLGFNLTLADETLVIDMNNHTALVDGVSQINNLDFDDNNQWWSLLPGNNEIKLASSGATDDLTAHVRFRHAKIGIA